MCLVSIQPTFPSVRSTAQWHSWHEDCQGYHAQPQDAPSERPAGYDHLRVPNMGSNVVNANATYHLGMILTTYLWWYYWCFMTLDLPHLSGWWGMIIDIQGWISMGIWMPRDISIYAYLSIHPSNLGYKCSTYLSIHIYIYNLYIYIYILYYVYIHIILYYLYLFICMYIYILFIFISCVSPCILLVDISGQVTGH